MSSLLNHLPMIGLTVFLLWLFLVGTVVGSLLNVCIYRLPMEKSILWPGSRCGHCFQPIRWYDNLPLVSYLWLRGRCRTCGTRFSFRYFLIELLTGLVFVGLFYLDVLENRQGFTVLHEQREWMAARFLPAWQGWVVFAHHAVLVCFLIVATFCDLDYREIPLSVTVPGTLVGLIAAVLWPWPWPNALHHVAPAVQPWWWGPPTSFKLPSGLYPWPFWYPLPPGFAPGGNWQTGLATGLAGALVGSLMLRAVRFLFTLGLGIEALGLGDADLMMMAGAFLGWQAVVVAFVLGVFAGLFFGIIQLLVHGDNLLPFGPALALGTVAAFLFWPSIGPHAQMTFFAGPILLAMVVGSSILMLLCSYILRLLR